jgi:hypothetical protein
MQIHNSLVGAAVAGMPESPCKLAQTDYNEEELAVAAAKILFTLRTRKLMQWPDWIPRPSNKPDARSMEPEVELPPLTEGWPKRPQWPLHVRASGCSLSLAGVIE